MLEQVRHYVLPECESKDQWSCRSEFVGCDMEFESADWESYYICLKERAEGCQAREKTGSAEEDEFQTIHARLLFTGV